MMLMRWVMALGVFVAALGLGACKDSSGTGAAGGGSGGGSGIKVGLLVSGSTSDHGWNQLAAESLTKLVSEQGIDYTPRQQVSKDQAADAIRQFESKGYALVIAHGYEYLDVAKELTDPSKPTAVKVKIAVSGGDVDSPNFASLYYDLGPASYQIGIIAARVSQTGKIAFVGGQPFPTVMAMQRGFEAGAKSVKPGITVTSVYTDNWDDPAIAKSKTEALIAQGVDVIMQNVDAASSGVFEAVKENNSKLKTDGHQVVYTFGANSDQNGNAICPDYTLASAVIRLDVAFGKVIEQVKTGTFHGGLVREDLNNGVAVTVMNPKLVGKVIDADTQKMVEEAGKKLAAGVIKVPGG